MPKSDIIPQLYETEFLRVSDLDHGGDGMDTAQILDNALGEVSNAQADGPVGVSLQPDHLIGTKYKTPLLASVCN